MRSQRRTFTFTICDGLAVLGYRSRPTLSKHKWYQECRRGDWCRKRALSLSPFVRLRAVGSQIEGPAFPQHGNAFSDYNASVYIRTHNWHQLNSNGYFSMWTPGTSLDEREGCDAPPRTKFPGRLIGTWRGTTRMKWLYWNQQNGAEIGSWVTRRFRRTGRKTSSCMILEWNGNDRNLSPFVKTSRMGPPRACIPKRLVHRRLISTRLIRTLCTTYDSTAYVTWWNVEQRQLCRQEACFGVAAEE